MTFLAALEIEAFRGFAERQVIPLDSDAVVITGSNGLGKTSLTDAVTWVLTGQLPQMPSRQGRREEEFVVNRYREGAEAKVALQINHRGDRWRLSRQGTSRNGTVLTVDIGGSDRYVGDEAVPVLCDLFGVHEQREVDLAVQGWGILRQDAMRAVLASPAEEFQARLRDILGLGVLAEFEKAAKDACKQAVDASGAARREADEAQRALAAAQSELDQNQARALEAATVDASAAGLSLRLREFETWVEVEPDLLNRARGAREVMQACGTLATELRSHALALRTAGEALASSDAVDDAALDSSQQRLAEIEADLARVMEALTAAERDYSELRGRADDLARLAAAAIPLLSAHCPVCSQEIDSTSVESRLRHILEAGDGAEDLETAGRAVAQSRANVVGVQTLLEAERRTLELLRARLARRRHAEAQRQEVQRLFESLARSSMVGLPALARAQGLSPAALEETAEALDAIQRLLRPVVRSTQDHAVESRIPRLAQRVAETRQQHEIAVRKLEALAKRANDAKQLADAATAASLDVTEDALATLDPYFGEVFRRLAAHPTFSELGLFHDVYYGKARTWARLTDPLTGVEANPQLILSEGQLNVVALSYFIAFALTAGDKALPFVILDDPLQSLDDMNVLGFSDFCRHLRDSRQVIVTTHDRRFGNLLSRKLKPRRADQSSARIHFASWDRDGPRLAFERFEAEDEPALLGAANGDGPTQGDLPSFE